MGVRAWGMTDAGKGQAVPLLLAAHQFYMAAERCARGSTSNDDAWLVYPEVVNRAFAIELALKGLVQAHLNQKARGHDLQELFKKLPPEVQQELRGAETPNALFADRLRNVKDAFQQWRYAHEHPDVAVSVEFLLRLSVSAIEALRIEVAPSAILVLTARPRAFFKSPG